jgi:hypothetical protein
MIGRVATDAAALTFATLIHLARGDAVVRGENESPNRSGIEKLGSPSRT